MSQYRSHGQYALIRFIQPDSIQVFGHYDVLLINEGKPSGRQSGGGEDVEIVETGKDSSAAEWKRLLDEANRMNAVIEVMES